MPDASAGPAYEIIDHTYDVVVVGAGGAGLRATLGMAEQGLRLTDFHSNGMVCSPSRAAFISGKYQQRTGVDGVVTADPKMAAQIAAAEKRCLKTSRIV